MPSNPPAFPRPIGDALIERDRIHNEAQSGMSLRDYFAAKALQGIVTSDKFSHYSMKEAAAEQAYAYADAMLAAREETR